MTPKYKKTAMAGHCGFFGVGLYWFNKGAKKIDK